MNLTGMCHGPVRRIGQGKYHNDSWAKIGFAM